MVDNRSPREMNLLTGMEKIHSKVDDKKEKNILLFVGAIYGHMIDAIQEYETQQGVHFRIALLYDNTITMDELSQKQLSRIDIVIGCDTHSSSDIQKALLPYQHELLAVTCRPESYIPMLEQVIPNVPYLRTPTTASLRWTTDKIHMRERLSNFDASINPRYAIIKNQSKKSIKKVIDSIGFPLIVKPAGLAASRLVSICYHEEEFQEVLATIFATIDSIYTETKGTYEPRILVEQFMEGDMYSIDAYVSQKGKIFFCPLVYVKTGRDIGFDDFFGYKQLTPTKLSKEHIEEAEAVATKAIYGAALRSTTVHIELMRLEDGWKIIEMGPRMGGFRHMMYEHSFGMNHVMNDLLIRMGKPPLIPKKVRGYTMAMKFFAKKEGVLKSLTGIKKAQELDSCKRLYINKKVGDTCTFAKHGGSSVFNIILFNKERSALLADIRRLETMIRIEVE